jgi:chaperonin GroEL
MKEKKDRVDDALHATKAAIEEGIVPGGGVALLYASQILSRDQTGSALVRQACRMPFQQILVNAGYEATEAQMLGKYKLVESGNDNWAGIDVDSGEVINMKESGIIDPTKVTRTALQNAASIAGTILLTECTVVDEPQDNNQQPQLDPMMGMM